MVKGKFRKRVCGAAHIGLSHPWHRFSAFVYRINFSGPSFFSTVFFQQAGESKETPGVHQAHTEDAGSKHSDTGRPGPPFAAIRVYASCLTPGCFMHALYCPAFKYRQHAH
jgi:hypothetical protein